MKISKTLGPRTIITLKGTREQKIRKQNITIRWDLPHNKMTLKGTTWYGLKQQENDHYQSLWDIYQEDNFEYPKLHLAFIKGETSPSPAWFQVDGEIHLPPEIEALRPLVAEKLQLENICWTAGNYPIRSSRRSRRPRGNLIEIRSLPSGMMMDLALVLSFPPRRGGNKTPINCGIPLGFPVTRHHQTKRSFLYLLYAPPGRFHKFKMEFPAPPQFSKAFPTKVDLALGIALARIKREAETKTYRTVSFKAELIAKFPSLPLPHLK